jgi:uncharacterized protein YqeY
MRDEGIRQRLRSSLPAAMKARDAAAVAALRSALAAIDNAGAVDNAGSVDSGGGLPATEGHPDFAGTVAGLGAAEMPRRQLTDTDAGAIVRAEVTDRLAAAAGYERTGHDGQASRLRAEASILDSFLDGPDATG